MVFVDLDGTLISTDLLYETIVQAIRHDPQLLLQFPSWLLRGGAHLKPIPFNRRKSQPPVTLGLFRTEVTPDPEAVDYLSRCAISADALP